MDRIRVLAEVLDSLREHVDKGRLGIGFVGQACRAVTEPKDHLADRAVGSLLRSLGLQTTRKTHDANGMKRVRCLIWSDEVESFISKTLHPDRHEENVLAVQSIEQESTIGHPVVGIAGDDRAGVERILEQRLVSKISVESGPRDIVTFERFEAAVMNTLNIDFLADYAGEFLEIAS